MLVVIPQNLFKELNLSLFSSDLETGWIGFWGLVTVETQKSRSRGKALAVRGPKENQMFPFTYHLGGLVTVSGLQSRFTGELRDSYGQVLALENFPFYWVTWFNRKTMIDEGLHLPNSMGHRDLFMQNISYRQQRIAEPPSRAGDKAGHGIWCLE